MAVALGLLGSLPLASAAAAGQPACAGADAAAGDASVAMMRSAVVCLVNQQRAARHLPALHSSRRLDASAQRWTNDMIRTSTFSHGPDFSSRIDATGYFWSTAGENIATGFATPREVVTAWMASLDHCTNILNPTFRDVGTGVNSQALGRYGASTWTQDFGLWMGHHAPSHNFGPQHGCPYTS
ncbi:MAG: CAP domain-containing protein [Solirubrobacteraceae bacterium]